MKCPACAGVSTAPRPEPEPMFEVVEDTSAPLVPPPPPRAKPVAKPVVTSDDDDDDDRRGYGMSKSRYEDEDEDEKPRPKKKKKPKWKRTQGGRSDDSGRSLEGRIINGGVVGGLLAMLIAVVWFVVGVFAFDLVFYYPPILFVVGLIAFAKGLAGGGE